MTTRPVDDQEGDILTLLFFVWRKRRTIILGSALGMLVGGIYALIAKPSYTSEAVIALKDEKSGGGGSILSQFGGLDGSVLSQFGSMSTNLDRMQILIEGREIARAVIQDNNLLPRLYPTIWDEENKRWKEDPPSMRNAVEALRAGTITTVVDAKKKILTLSAHSGDPILARDLAVSYVRALGSKIRDDARKDAEANRKYLDEQLSQTQDPFMRERIQNLMVGEIEKVLLVGTKAFDVLEAPVVPMHKTKPKRARIVLISTLIGAVLSVFLVMLVGTLEKRKALARAS